MKKTIEHFELEGYHLDYYIDKKFVGALPIAEPDRETFGYEGRRTHVLSEDIVLKGKRFKAGTLVTTELIPICGKSKVNQIIIGRGHE